MSDPREREAREPRVSRAEAWPGHGVMMETALEEGSWGPLELWVTAPSRGVGAQRQRSSDLNPFHEICELKK